MEGHGREKGLCCAKSILDEAYPLKSRAASSNDTCGKRA
jgi:hypothetical protein